MYKCKYLNVSVRWKLSHIPSQIYFIVGWGTQKVNVLLIYNKLFQMTFRRARVANNKLDIKSSLTDFSNKKYFKFMSLSLISTTFSSHAEDVLVIYIMKSEGTRLHD